MSIQTMNETLKPFCMEAAHRVMFEPEAIHILAMSAGPGAALELVEPSGAPNIRLIKIANTGKNARAIVGFVIEAAGDVPEAWNSRIPPQCIAPTLNGWQGWWFLQRPEKVRAVLNVAHALNARAGGLKRAA